MFKSQKIQLVVFIILLVIAVSELVYFFYYKPLISKSKLSPTPAPYITIAAFKQPDKVNDNGALSSITKIESGLKMDNIITQAEAQGKKFTSHLSILNGLDQALDCTAPEGKCFKIDNLKGAFWKANGDILFPIKYSGPFIVKLKFNGTNGAAGVSLTGNLGSTDELWYKNLFQIFFGIGNNGKRLYIDAKSNEPKSLILYDNTFDNKIDGIYVLYNEMGTAFLVTDLSYKEITYIDVNKATDNKFLNGIFPVNLFYVGYAVAPDSDLVVYDFSILN
jgi:hypothetical protein